MQSVLKEFIVLLNKKNMKLIFTPILISLTLSSCVTHIPQSNAYEQALQQNARKYQALQQAELQPEMDESELKSLLEFSEQQFDQYKKHIVDKYGEEGWKGIRRRFSAINLMNVEDKNTAISGAKQQILVVISNSQDQPAQTSTTSATTGASELKKELDQAQELLDEGLITKEEYEAQRKKILSNYY